MKHQDVSYESDEEYEYECLHCGKIATASSYPGDCPDCGEAVRNRRMSFE